MDSNQRQVRESIKALAACIETVGDEERNSILAFINKQQPEYVQYFATMIMGYDNYIYQGTVGLSVSTFVVHYSSCIEFCALHHSSEVSHISKEIQPLLGLILSMWFTRQALFWQIWIAERIQLSVILGSCGLRTLLFNQSLIGCTG